MVELEPNEILAKIKLSVGGEGEGEYKLSAFKIDDTPMEFSLDGEKFLTGEKLIENAQLPDIDKSTGKPPIDKIKGLHLGGKKSTKKRRRRRRKRGKKTRTKN